MTYKLWVDDQSYDPNTPDRNAPDEFKVACSSSDAIYLTKVYGPPSFMDLDHDLGERNGQEDTVKTYLKWLFETHPFSCPEYAVHSANKPGQEWIVSYMDSWKRSLAIPKEVVKKESLSEKIALMAIIILVLPFSLPRKFPTYVCAIGLLLTIPISLPIYAVAWLLSKVFHK